MRVSARITIRASNVQFDCGINVNTVIMYQWYEATYVYHYPLLLPSPRRRTCPPNVHLLQIMTETNLRNGVEGFRKRFRFEDFKKFTRLSDREGHSLSYLSAVHAYTHMTTKVLACARQNIRTFWSLCVHRSNFDWKRSHFNQSYELPGSPTNMQHQSSTAHRPLVGRSSTARRPLVKTTSTALPDY